MAVGAFLFTLMLALPAGAGQGPCNCGSWPWQDSCTWSPSTVINSGFSYYFVKECEKTCNGPNDHNHLCCDVDYASDKATTYKLSGGASWESIFNLSAGWEQQTTNHSGCHFSNSCDQPNCCVQGYAYHKYSFEERVQWMWNSSAGWFCDTCSANTRTGVKETFVVPVCSGNLHSQYEPALLGNTGYCTTQGLP